MIRIYTDGAAKRQSGARAAMELWVLKFGANRKKLAEGFRLRPIQNGAFGVNPSAPRIEKVRISVQMQFGQQICSGSVEKVGFGVGQKKGLRIKRISDLWLVYIPLQLEI